MSDDHTTTTPPIQRYDIGIFTDWQGPRQYLAPTGTGRYTLYDDHLAAMAAATLRWIPVSERMPDAQRVVPVLLDMQHSSYRPEPRWSISLALIYDGNWISDESMGRFNVPVVYWLDIPAYPPITPPPSKEATP